MKLIKKIFFEISIKNFSFSKFKIFRSLFKANTLNVENFIRNKRKIYLKKQKNTKLKNKI